MGKTSRRRGQPKMGAPFAKTTSRRNNSPKVKDTRREQPDSDWGTRQLPVGDRDDMEDRHRHTSSEKDHVLKMRLLGAMNMARQAHEDICPLDD
mgnify:FL=1